MDKIVTIKPIKKNVWGNFSRFQGCLDTIGPSISSTSGRVKTGLDDTQRKELEAELGFDLSPESNFWTDYRVVFTDKPLILDLSDARQKLDYYFLLGHKRVANSYVDRRLFPYADYIIYDEVKEAEVKNRKTEVEGKAFASLFGLTSEGKSNLLRLFGYKDVNRMNPEIIQDRLTTELKKNPALFLKKVEDKNIEIRVMLKRLIEARIVTLDREIHYYGQISLGHNEDAAVSFLLDPENQVHFINLKEHLEAKDVVMKPSAPEIEQTEEATEE